MALVRQSLLLTDRRANRTPLEMAITLHGQESLISSTILDCMRNASVSASTLDRLVLQATRSPTFTQLEADGTVVAPSALDQQRYVDMGGWAKDGQCRQVEFSQNLTSDGVIEYYGLPSQDVLTSLTSTGRPVVLRGAGAYLGLRTNLWSRQDILHKFGGFDILVGGAQGKTSTQVADYVTRFHKHVEMLPEEIGDYLGYTFEAVKSLSDDFRMAIEQDTVPLQTFLDSHLPFSSLPEPVRSFSHPFCTHFA